MKNEIYSKLPTMKDQYESNIELLNSVFDFNWSFSIENYNEEYIHNLKQISICAKVDINNISRAGMGFGQSYDEAINNALSSIIDTFKMPKKIKDSEVIKKEENKEIVLTFNDKVIGAVKSISMTQEKEIDTTIEKPADVIPKVRKIMDKYNIDQDTAMKYAVVCNKFKITTKEVLLKYLQAWNNNIKTTDELVSTNVKQFIDWGYNNEEEFKID